MKVLMFSNCYPSSRSPNRGIFHYHLLSALAQQCEIRVVAPLPWWTRLRQPGELFSVPEEDSTEIRATFPTYWSVPRYTAFHATGMYYSLRSHVVELRREFPFDVILAAWAYPDAVAAARMARDLGLPLVVKVLGSDINEVARIPALGQQIAVALSQAKYVLAVSGALRERVIDLGIAPEKVIMHHNGVDGKQFSIGDRQEARTKLGLPLDRKLICYVGNLKIEKGVDVLVEAIGALAHLGHPDIELYMVGEGPMREVLQTAAQRLGVADRVHLVGKRLHKEVPEWITASDLFCLPSRREGCPNVVLEGLASGRPVVATEVGGVPELIHAENGILVPPENPDALAAGLIEALERTWEPQELRQSVESLSWSDISLAVYHILEKSITEFATVSDTRPLARGKSL